MSQPIEIPVPEIPVPTNAPARLPPHAPGLRIGLYGGSFNPPHLGHRLASLMAMRRLRLDRLWWIVTPGNPLKDRSELGSLANRIGAATALARHPRIDVTGFEAAIGSRFTRDTLRYLTERGPGTRFVWIMGADSLASFHRWRGWEEIAALVPMAVIDRPGWTLKATQSRAGQALASFRLPEAAAPVLADCRAPAWIFLHGPRSPLSSTSIRNETARAAATRVEKAAIRALS